MVPFVPFLGSWYPFGGLKAPATGPFRDPPTIAPAAMGGEQACGLVPFRETGVPFGDPDSLGYGFLDFSSGFWGKGSV